MTIQFSVTVWTVICFVAVYLVLRNLLFKPMLDVMDKRRAKIAGAKRAHEECERIREQRLAEMLEEREKKALEARKNADIEADRVRLEGKQSLERAKEERIRVVSDYRERMETEYKRDMDKVTEPIKTVADDFLSHIFSSGH